MPGTILRIMGQATCFVQISFIKFATVSHTRGERQGAGRGKNPGWFVPRTEEAQASIRPGFARSVQTSRLGKIYHRPDPPPIGWPADTGPMGGEKSARARHLNRMVVSAIPRLSRCVTKLWQDLSWERSAGDPRARARPGQAAHPAGPGCCRGAARD